MTSLGISINSVFSVLVLPALLQPIVPMHAQEAPVEKVDLGVLHEIKTQAFQHPQVMEDLFYISDVYGPRITNSPNHRAAAEWAVKRLRSYGLQNVRLEPWGPFGNSWQLKRFYGAIVEPSYSPLIGVPLAWTAGTDGPVTGEVVYAPIKSEEDFAEYRGKLKGKIVLVTAPKDIPLPIFPEAHRFTDGEVESRTIVPDPSRIPDGFGGCQHPGANISPDHLHESSEPALARRQREAINEFFRNEGAVALVNYDTRGNGGIVRAQAGGSESPTALPPPPMVNIIPEQYNRLVRLIQHGLSPKVTLDIQTDFYSNDQMSFNVIGEIPGTTKKDEVVMLGGHLDSWHGATGATDDGIGSSVAIEAARILMQLHRPMARTVRIALWGGEEEGLLGSMYYVQHHFAPRNTMKQTIEYAKLDAYYNQDYGAGRYRAIWADGNDEIAAIFKQWAAPIRDLGFEAVAGATSAPQDVPGGTDSRSFSWIGLDGFAFMQDPLECQYRAAHTNMDFYDRVQPGDAMQSSAIMAWFVYNTANRPSMLPRLDAPAPMVRASGGH